MTGSVLLLAGAMDETWARFRSRLDGPDDDGFSWERLAHPWTVCRHDAGRWTYHHEEPDPVPAPFTSIGWRLVHVTLCKVWKIFCVLTDRDAPHGGEIGVLRDLDRPKNAGEPT